MAFFIINRVYFYPQSVGSETAALTLEVGIHDSHYYFTQLRLAAALDENGQPIYKIELKSALNMVMLEHMKCYALNTLPTNSIQIIINKQSCQFTLSTGAASAGLKWLLNFLHQLEPMPSYLLSFLIESMHQGTPHYAPLITTIMSTLEQDLGTALQLSTELLEIGGPNTLPMIANHLLIHKQPALAYETLSHIPSHHTDFAYAQHQMARFMYHYAVHLTARERLILMLQHSQHCGAQGHYLLNLFIAQLCQGQLLIKPSQHFADTLIALTQRITTPLPKQRIIPKIFIAEPTTPEQQTNTSKLFKPIPTKL